MNGQCYFNGEYVNVKDIAISPFDYGFNFGAGIYEVFAFRNRISFQLEEHLVRLCGGGNALGIPVDKAKIQNVCETLIKNSQPCDGYVYIQLTFGGYGKRNHHLPEAIEPTVLIYTFDVPCPSLELFNKGFSLHTVPNTRWQKCHIKTTSLIPNILSLREAVKKGYSDCLFIDEDSQILECSAANLFFVEDGTLKTPPIENNILPGITRATVIKLAEENSIPLEICDCSLERLKKASEVFITSTTKNILPVGMIDDKAVTQTPGPISKLLHGKWREFFEQETAEQ